IRDILARMPLIRVKWQENQAGVFHGQPQGDAVSDLVRLTVNAMESRPWETIDVLNGTRLAFFASPARQELLGDLLSALRRLADVSVVMNARLYAVDREVYAKEVAPLFARAGNAEEAPKIIPISKDLFKRVTRGNVLLESEVVKIRPHQPTAFLSRRSAF